MVYILASIEVFSYRINVGSSPHKLLRLFHLNRYLNVSDLKPPNLDYKKKELSTDIKILFHSHVYSISYESGSIGRV